MKVFSEAEMVALGAYIAKNIPLPAVIELVGDVGVGKTTFTRGLARGLGIDTPVTSPSFTIAKRYPFPTINTESENSVGELVHYDFYRLDDPGIMRDELADVISEPNSIVVVEWGDAVSSLLPLDRIQLKFSRFSNDEREIVFSGLPGGIIQQLSSGLWKTCGKDLENRGKPVEKPRKSVKKSSQNVENEDNVCAKAVETAVGKSSCNHCKNDKESSSSVKLYLDTSSDTCILRLNELEYTRTGKYDLAEKIFTFIHQHLQDQNLTWQDITEITFYSGPGSFTGLRIGAAIVNALADQLQIPLFDHHGQRHQIILPEYGREANITPPRK